MKRKNPIDEARRYVENAKKTLKENGGNQSKDVSDGGFRIANSIIDRCEAMVN